MYKKISAKTNFSDDKQMGKYKTDLTPSGGIKTVTEHLGKNAKPGREKDKELPF